MTPAAVKSHPKRDARAQTPTALIAGAMIALCTGGSAGGTVLYRKYFPEVAAEQIEENKAAIKATVEKVAALEKMMQEINVSQASIAADTKSTSANVDRIYRSVEKLNGVVSGIQSDLAFSRRR